MNVNPFSRATERPWASIGLAGLRASIERDAAILLIAVYQQQAEGRTPQSLADRLHPSSKQARR